MSHIAGEEIIRNHRKFYRRQWMPPPDQKIIVVLMSHRPDVEPAYMAGVTIKMDEFEEGAKSSPSRQVHPLVRSLLYGSYLTIKVVGADHILLFKYIPFTKHRRSSKHAKDPDLVGGPKRSRGRPNKTVDPNDGSGSRF